jgi:Uma2 family endonuclease
MTLATITAKDLQLPLLIDASHATVRVSSAEFDRLCQINPDLRLELTKDGELIVMPPVGGESGDRELNFGSQLYVWNQLTRLGKAFSSSTIFILPNGSKKSPDTAWVELSRWEALTPEDRKKFPPLAPDFVIELRSETDRLPDLQAKMQEYCDNGVRLGWLINPQQQQVEIYRIGNEVVILNAPNTLSGEDVLPGFTLDLSAIF